MASALKRQRVEFADPENVANKIWDDDKEPGGISSDGESDLDRQLENQSEESR